MTSGLTNAGVCVALSGTGTASNGGGCAPTATCVAVPVVPTVVGLLTPPPNPFPISECIRVTNPFLCDVEIGPINQPGTWPINDCILFNHESCGVGIGPIDEPGTWPIEDCLVYVNVSVVNVPCVVIPINKPGVLP